MPTRLCNLPPALSRFSVYSSYDAKHGIAEVTSCTREFFQNLYDHVKQRDAHSMRTSLFMRRRTGEQHLMGGNLEEIAYTLNIPLVGQAQELKEEVARVQVTPTHSGQRALVCFAQKWDGSLDSRHLLLHSQKTTAQGNAGGIGEGFKVAANNLLLRFSPPHSEPCTVIMVMNGHTWRFVYKEYQGSGIHQFVVEEYDTDVSTGILGSVCFCCRCNVLEHSTPHPSFADQCDGRVFPCLCS